MKTEDHDSAIILSSHQPDFFPYMGYFYKVFQSDIFVLSDDVQYSKSGRHNYNEILTANGPLRLTLPIRYHAEPLNQIRVSADERWVSRTLKTLHMEYKGAEHFHSAFPVLEEMLLKAPGAASLADFNCDCILGLVSRFGLDGRWFIRSSRMNLKFRRDARIIEMCKELKADVYLSGEGAKEYHVEEDYQKNHIQLRYTDYQPVAYPQVGRPSTVNMSVIDYAMNCGFEIPRGWERWPR